jgi:DNA-binding beta-propeller fold protein YncE
VLDQLSKVIPIQQQKLTLPPRRYHSPSPGWLYVLDTNSMGDEARILLIDPASERIAGSFQTSYAPDMVLSPDGQRVYVTSSRLKQREHMLSVIETTTGQVIKTLNFANRLMWGWEPTSSFLAIAPGGRLLYMLTRQSIRQGLDEYWIQVFDTDFLEFLPSRALVPSCAGSQLLPVLHSTLYVLCGGTNRVYSMDAGGFGIIPREPLQLLPATKMLPTGQMDWKGDTSQAAVMPGGESIVLLKRDGRLLKVAAVTGGITEEAKEPLLVGSSIPGNISALSSDGRSWYVPAKSLAYTGKQADEILVFDTSSMTISNRITPSQPFLNLAFSASDGRLYATAPWNQTVLVFDGTTLQELKPLRVGVTPAVIAPAPQ